MKWTAISIFRDFRFWILLFFLVRMIGITYPPLEVGHNWRQSFTCMVARNFLEEDPNIFYPRIDYAGDRPGIVASEFPVFNYLIYLAAKLFGYDHWYGRLINLIISSLGLYFFFLIIRKYVNEKTAFFSGMLLLFSIWFIFSWKIMPDTFSVSLMIMAMYFGLEYLERKRLLSLMLFFLFSSLGGLSKIPSTLILGILVVPILHPGFGLGRRVILSAVAALSLLLIAAWYFLWEPYLLKSYQNQLYFPFAFSEGLAALAGNWKGALAKVYFESFYSYAAFVVFMAGVFLLIRRKSRLLAAILVISFMVLFFYAVKTGDIFPTHNYYIIPFVPVMALIGGYALDGLPWPRVAYLVLALVAIESVANQHVDFHPNYKEMYKLELEDIADRVSSGDDLIAITGGNNPQELYFAHRKGWILDNAEFLDDSLIRHLKERGCRYLFVNRNVLEQVLPYPVVFRDTHYIVYQP